MKTFYKMITAFLLIAALIFIGANMILSQAEENNLQNGRPYHVEISRLCNVIEQKGLSAMTLENCRYVTQVTVCTENFYETDSDYCVQKINGVLYRFDYRADMPTNKNTHFALNLGLGAMTAVILGILFFLRHALLAPFERLSDVPFALSKGNLTVPIPENQSRFFGRFLWGIDLLREHMEEQKQHELALQREKKTLLLSLSHDIKTPLSAIKLYSKALSKGLYSDVQKQRAIAENIDAKADEIGNYVSQIIRASREDFLSLEVDMQEFYLSQLMEEMRNYYTEKLALVQIHFEIAPYDDCLLKGDLQRSIEVIQNIMENAVKYGDGHLIQIAASEEEGCILISVTNGGCTLTTAELPHIFESFWRGTNAEHITGSGLGLYICRCLMQKMNGEIFAQTENNLLTVTCAFAKA